MSGRVVIPAVSSRTARHMARSLTGSGATNFGGCESDDETMAIAWSRPTRTAQSLTDPLLGGSYSSVHYESIYDSNEFSSQRNSIEVMRKRLRSHFMTPYQKFKHRGRKPWKLLLQLLKLVIVTVQVFLFASELFAVVDFFNDSTQVFNYMFLEDKDNPQDYSLYRKDQLYSQVNYTLHQYYQIHETSVGTFGLPVTENHTVEPIKICIYSYGDSSVNPENESYVITQDTNYTCQDLLPPDKSDANMTTFITRNNLPISFDSIINIALMANVHSFHVRRSPNRPECYTFNVTIQFDNSNHDGRVPVKLGAHGTLRNCGGKFIDDDDGYQAMRTFRIFFDVFTILICSASILLCLRSIKRHFQLVQATRYFFLRVLNDHLSYWDCLDLMNLWFVLIVISDSSAIVGSLLKMIINVKEDSLYTVCSLFLGTAVLLTWAGLLRYLGYLKQYNVNALSELIIAIYLLEFSNNEREISIPHEALLNLYHGYDTTIMTSGGCFVITQYHVILLVTLKASAPSVLRFCLCGSLLYFGYLFCGWIVLGPYHVKFRNLLTVSECMFSLINGDDMFTTFAEMETKSYAVWVFSKIYLYSFISLFIYVVLSLFIGIIGDTYERIKDWGHPPCTKLQRFVHGSACQRCATEYTEELQESEVTAISSVES